jgi:hypothetical protein
MLNIIMLSVSMLNVVRLNVIMFNVVRPSVIMLNVVMLSVVAPICPNSNLSTTADELQDFELGGLDGVPVGRRRQNSVRRVVGLFPVLHA